MKTNIMKKTLSTLLIIGLFSAATPLFAQTENANGNVNTTTNVKELKTSRVASNHPTTFSYQAAMRDASGVMANEELNITVSILEGASDGTEVFTEDHVATTTAQGIVNLQIGSVEDLSVVEWSSEVYFIKLTVNSVEMGTSQIQAVPYAFSADTAMVALNAYWDLNESTSELSYTEGQVGIGIDNPIALLDVSRNSDETNSQLWVGQDGEGDATMAFSIDEGQIYSLGIDNDDDDKLKISTAYSASNGDEALTIDSDGNVGIGTSSPEANLQVEGGAKIGEQGVVISEIIELIGTTSTLFYYTSISLPSGYTLDNCRVLSLEIQESGSYWRSMGYTIDGVDGSIFSSLSDNIWIYYPDSSTMQGQSYRITLMKVQ
jgi:hypothetical protein